MTKNSCFFQSIRALLKN